MNDIERHLFAKPTWPDGDVQALAVHRRQLHPVAEFGDPPLRDVSQEDVPCEGEDAERVEAPVDRVPPLEGGVRRDEQRVLLFC